MKAGGQELEQRTIETRLNCAADFELLDQVLAFFARLRHQLWRDLIIKELPINELKSSYIKDWGLTARQFNSLAKDVLGMSQALEELKKTNAQDLHGRISAQLRGIEKLKKAIKQSRSHLAAIKTYRLKLSDWKIKSLASKKPKMPLSIQGKYKERLLRDLAKLRFSLHQKKRRLAILEHRLKKLNETRQPSLCFGSKKLFKAQFHLEQNGYSDHKEWLDAFQAARSNRMTFVGSSDESFGNQTVQYNPLTKRLSFRLPNAEPFQAKGKYLLIENVEFTEFLREEYFRALSPPAAGKKSQKSRLPVTYRFVRRINENTKARAYYLQVSFATEAPEVTSIPDSGMIGVDLNADHLAVSETDRFGNWIDSYALPFDLRGLSSDQAEAILGDLVAVVAEDARKKNKPIALEELDFAQKKVALRLLPKCRRQGLSQFAYSHFMAALASRARREGVQLYPINPAYTSLIGAYKYQGLSISSHEKAALAIARRAQGYTEDLGVFQGTLPSQAMMTEKTEFRETSRHTWGFYSDHQAKIRKLFIEDKPRPILPIKRALSLARGKRSLHQSLTATWEKRVFFELRRSSG